jgi:hypothetical protein
MQQGHASWTCGKDMWLGNMALAKQNLPKGKSSQEK